MNNDGKTSPKLTSIASAQWQNWSLEAPMGSSPGKYCCILLEVLTHLKHVLYSFTHICAHRAPFVGLSCQPGACEEDADPVPNPRAAASPERGENDLRSQFLMTDQAGKQLSASAWGSWNTCYLDSQASPLPLRPPRPLQLLKGSSS